LQNYINDKYNQLKHRFENITRMDAWKRINLHGGIVQIPAHALATVAIRARRKVGIDGTVQFEGMTYEVKGLYDATVDILKGVFEERKNYIVAHDIKTGKNYEVVPLKPLTLGEFRSHAETPHQTLVKESAALPLTGVTLYSEPNPNSAIRNPKLLQMPIRTKEEREIKDPFDVDHFADIGKAMDGFFEIVGIVFIPQEERRSIEEAIIANNLSKKFVENLALEVRAQMTQRRIAV